MNNYIFQGDIDKISYKLYVHYTIWEWKLESVRVKYFISPKHHFIQEIFVIIWELLIALKQKKVSV